MIELEGLGIKTFANIDYLVFERAKFLLLKRFDEIVQYDYTIDKTRLSTRDLEPLDNYCNSHYWIDELKPIHRDRHKKKLNRLIIDFSLNLHEQIRVEIIEKCVMINQAPESSKKAKCVIFNHSSIGLNIIYTYCKIQTIIV